MAVLAEGCEHLVDDERFITLEGRQKNWPELKIVLEDAFITRPQQEWIDLLGDVAPIAPVNNISDAFSDAQVVHRNMLVEAEHPVVGTYKMPGNPIKFVGRNDGPEEFRPAPTLGQHNRETLTALLGYSEDDITQLEKRWSDLGADSSIRSGGPMPVYEYYCEPCAVKFDKMRPMSQRNDPIECPDCGTVTGDRQVEQFRVQVRGALLHGQRQRAPY